MMIIDIHIHEKKYSSDSALSLRDIVIQAKDMGLDGVCITDHESNGIMEEAHALGKAMDFLILVGAEVLTYEGDLLVFGLEHIPQHKIHAKELLDRVLKEGGVAISAHPFRKNNRGMGNYIKNLPHLSGIEAFNGTTPLNDNLQAYYLGEEMKLPLLAGSDAHHLHQLGKYATMFPDGIRDERDFIEAVKTGRLQPVTYHHGCYKTIHPFHCNFKVI